MTNVCSVFFHIGKYIWNTVKQRKQTQRNMHPVMVNWWIGRAETLRNVDISLCYTLHACVLQSCLILCNPLDWRPPGSSVHGILQASILEWVARPFSRGSSQPMSLTFHALAGGFFTTSATWKVHVTPYFMVKLISIKIYDKIMLNITFLILHYKKSLFKDYNT